MVMAWRTSYPIGVMKPSSARCIPSGVRHSRAGRASSRRGIAMKTCSRCNVRKPLGEYYRCAARMDGRQSYCKACIGEYKTKYPPTSAAKRKHKRDYRVLHPDRRRARQALQRAVATGKLDRNPCEVCGGLKTEGHHDDYSKPKHVRWLCRECHIAEHSREGGHS